MKQLETAAKWLERQGIPYRAGVDFFGGPAVYVPTGLFITFDGRGSRDFDYQRVETVTRYARRAGLIIEYRAEYEWIALIPPGEGVSA